MGIGVLVLLGIALFYSYVSFKDYRKDRVATMVSIIDSLMPDVTKDISNSSLEALRVRMEFIVLKEIERNIQIKIVDTNQQTIYESDEFDWTCNDQLFALKQKVPLCTERTLEYSGGTLGKMYMTRDTRTFGSFFIKSNMPTLFLILVSFLSVLIFVLRYFLRKEMINPINRLVANLEGNFDLDQQDQAQAHEWNILSRSIFSYKEKIINYTKEQNRMSKDLEKEKLMSEITAQLAHDIRSPLAALDMMAANIPELDDKKRVLVRNATARIHNIANNLLDRNFNRNNNVSPQMFSSLIRSIVSEKREQYKSNPKVSIHDHLDEQMYGAFARIEINDFKRILSNLIDNAVESIRGSGFVRVALKQEQSHVIVEVFDNGVGIPPDMIEKVKLKGVTKRKEGSGLGLYFVDQKVQEWGGKLQIDSTVNQGTSMKLVLNKVPPPAWFVSEIVIDDDHQYVVLDDDRSIHNMWEARILNSVGRSVNMRYFEDEDSFGQWYRENKDWKNITYFFDYELLGNKNNGLDIIEKYNIAGNKILVTSHYENEDIQKRCEKYNVRMIPKELAGFVPIVSI